MHPATDIHWKIRSFATSVLALCALTGCNGGASFIPSDDPPNTPAQLNLLDDYYIDARRADDHDPGVWQFAVRAENGDIDPTIDYVWDFGNSPEMRGPVQTYVFGSSGRYPVRLIGLRPDGDLAVELSTDVEVTIPSRPNQPPVADAGPDQVVYEGESVRLDGSASNDLDSFELAYEWTQTLGPVNVALTQQGPFADFTAPLVSEDVTLLFTLSVSDEHSTAQDTVKITVLNVLEEEDLDPADSGDTDTNGEGDVVDEIDEEPVESGGQVDAETPSPPTPGQSPGPSGSTTLPPSTFLVRNEAELRDAAVETAFSDVNILVAGPITINSPVSFRRHAIVRMIGVGDHPTINVNMTFSGDWNDPTWADSGFTVLSRQASFRNLTFAGYQLSGSVIKGQADMELLDVSDCRFRDIGNILTYPNRVEPPQIASDTIYTKCIGAHQVVNGHIGVAGSEFLRCSNNQQKWAHCLYISARSVTAQNNSFDQSGHPFNIGAQVPGGVNSIYGNTITNPAPGNHPDGSLRQPRLCLINPDDIVSYMFNSAAGSHDRVWVGAADFNTHFFGENDYSQLVYSNVWYYDNFNNQFLTELQWRQLGYDNVSAGIFAPSAVRVRNEAELLAAAAQTATRSLHVLIDGTVTVTQPILFPSSSHVVRLVGIGANPRIRFDMPFNGNWSSSSNYDKDGITFRSRQAVVRNLTFENFHMMGAALDGSTAQLFDVSDCTFSNIGTQVYAPRTNPPATDQDAIHTRAIKVAGAAGMHVAIIGNRFENCSTNQRLWSHVLDVSAGSASVLDNYFTGCGNPFKVGGTVSAAGISIMGNTVTAPAPSLMPNGQRIQPGLGIMFTSDRTAFVHNVVSGQFHDPWTGSFNTQNHYVGLNNYTQMTYTGNWAADWSNGTAYSWAQWQALGFD